MLVSLWIIYNASKHLELDGRMVEIEKVLKNVADLYNEEHKGEKIHYMSPYFSEKAEIDPFKNKWRRGTMKGFKDRNIPSNNLKKGELIMWEGQYSEIEGKISLDKFIEDPNLVLLKRFTPEKKITIHGKGYEVFIFIKSNKAEKPNTQYIKTINKIVEENLGDTVVFSKDEFFNILTKRETDIKEQLYQYTFRCKLKTSSANKELKLVFQVNKEGERKYYQSFDIVENSKKENGYRSVIVTTNKENNYDGVFKVTLWNLNKVEIEIKDISLKGKVI